MKQKCYHKIFKISHSHSTFLMIYENEMPRKIGTKQLKNYKIEYKTIHA